MRKLRVVVAALMFAAIVFFFCDFTGIGAKYLGFAVRCQFVPALMRASFLTVAILALVTIFFGRVYCSIICPLGIFQDIVSHLASTRKKLRFTYRRGKTLIRVFVLLVFIGLMAGGLCAWAALIEPYGMFGRIAANLFAPCYRWGNNLLADWSQSSGNTLFYHVEVIASGAALAAVVFVILCILAWRWGRLYCNTICPVGTFLGLLSRSALVRPRIDPSRCNKCGKCARICKASCVNSSERKIDADRCVVCLNCVSQCPQKAIAYRFPSRNDVPQDTSQKAADVGSEISDVSNKKEV